MLKKRIIAVITILNDIAVQSIGYNTYLPLGNPVVLAENLDRWGADEIILKFIDITRKNLAPNFKILENIASKISTPIIYSGGISNALEAKNLIKSGADRLCFDALLNKNHKEIYKAAYFLGSQAIIINLPCNVENNNYFFRYNYLLKSKIQIDNVILDILNNEAISEIMLTDYLNEGKINSFNFNILKMTKIINKPLIIFGGVTEAKQINKAFKYSEISAVAIGNSLNYKEHAIQKIKLLLPKNSVRTINYD